MINIVEAVDNLISVYIAAEHPVGEPWHEEYKKRRKRWIEIVKENVRLEKKLTRFFNEEKKRVEMEYIFPYVADEDPNKSFWEKFKDGLKRILIPSAMTLAILGSEEVREENNIPMDVNVLDFSKFVSKYSFNIIKNITETTRKRVKRAIETSLELGEDREAMIKRVGDVIGDRKRATLIADTESVRAFNQGKIYTGKMLKKEFGLKVYKVWHDDNINSCLVCQGLHLTQVKEDELFDGGYDAPPSHPRCRCYLEIAVKR